MAAPKRPHPARQLVLLRGGCKYAQTCAKWFTDTSPLFTSTLGESRR